MKTWDIFCRVVDNYGDIGVCWRLARQLSQEYAFEVRLWVDDLNALAALCPEATLSATQTIEGIKVQHWAANFPSTAVPADVVIEAFACELPDSYIAAMLAQKQQGKLTQWFNLEYLSAEDWVEGCHGLNALQPQTGLNKTWFFPGFTQKTGGLLSEAKLGTQRDNFSNDRQALNAWREQIAGIKSPINSLWISLFAYENTALASLLNNWQQSPTPIICLVPSGRIQTSLKDCLAKQSPQLSFNKDSKLHLGNLQLIAIPFLTQLAYDQLLWACDLNFVRGEDSFVRAQWAQKPFVWHIYPQEDAAHCDKLEAFLDKYTSHAPPALKTAIEDLHRQWNLGQDCSQEWNALMKQHQDWPIHAQNWVKQLNSLGNLASNMVQFCQKTL